MFIDLIGNEQFIFVVSAISKDTYSISRQKPGIGQS